MTAEPLIQADTIRYDSRI